MDHQPILYHQLRAARHSEVATRPIGSPQRRHAMLDDYVFASETRRGSSRFLADNLMKRHIRPIAKAIGIHERLGWHTFRHTFGALLKANGEM